MAQLIPDVSPKNLSGLLDKTVGLARETAGTLIGNDSLKKAGQEQQKAGTDKIDAMQATAEAERAEAKASTLRQTERAADPDGDAGAGGLFGKVTGEVKQRAGGLFGDRSLQREGQAQSERGEADATATEKRAEAQAKEKSAATHEKAASKADADS